MNDYVYRFIAEERQRQLEMVNREAWKYESISNPSKIVSLKQLIQTKKAQKQMNVPCCA